MLRMLPALDDKTVALPESTSSEFNSASQTTPQTEEVNVGSGRFSGRLCIPVSPTAQGSGQGDDMNTSTLTRRAFVKSTALATGAAAWSARSYAQVRGANERVGIGVIGFGLIGRIHTRSYHGLPGSRVVAVADTYEPRRKAAAELIGSGVSLYADFRKLLEDKNVDAVVVATPDHWHALQTMLACAAGKDVYVEKPLHLFVQEGRWMQEVAQRHRRVVQVGTQQRSAPHYHAARQLLRDGRIGDIVSVQCNFFRNVSPGIGNPPDGTPPKELDWDMLLGPAPQRPYN